MENIFFSKTIDFYLKKGYYMSCAAGQCCLQRGNRIIGCQE